MTFRNRNLLKFINRLFSIILINYWTSLLIAYAIHNACLLVINVRL